MKNSQNIQQLIEQDAFLPIEMMTPNQRLKYSLVQCDFTMARDAIARGADVKLVDLAMIYRTGSSAGLRGLDLEYLFKARIQVGLDQAEKDDMLKIMSARLFIIEATVLIKEGAKATGIDLLSVCQEIISKHFFSHGKEIYYYFIRDLIKAGAAADGVATQLRLERLGNEDFRNAVAKVVDDAAAAARAWRQNLRDLVHVQMKAGDFVSADFVLKNMKDPIHFSVYEVIDDLEARHKFSYGDFLVFLKTYMHLIEHKEQLLIKMVVHRYIYAAEKLLDAGTNAKMISLSRSLLSCSNQEAFVFLKKLINAGAYEKLPEALQYAAERGLKDVEVLLLENCHKPSALLEALTSGYNHAVDLLIKSGAQTDSLSLVNVLEGSGASNLKKMNPAILDQLIAKALPEEKENAMRIAIQLGSDELVKKLLIHGVNVNKRNDGYAYLCYALISSNRSLNIVKQLISAGAAINTVSGGEFVSVTPLFSACRTSETLSMAYLLFAKGADINALNKEIGFNGTALEYYSTQTHLKSKHTMIALLTLWSEIDKVMKDSTLLPKKRIENALNIFIKHYTPNSSFLSRSLYGAPTPSSEVQIATKLKRDVMSTRDGEQFITDFDKLITQYKSNELNPDTTHREEQNLAAICERLVNHFKVEEIKNLDKEYAEGDLELKSINKWVASTTN